VVEGEAETVASMDEAVGAKMQLEVEEVEVVEGVARAEGVGKAIKQWALCMIFLEAVRDAASTHAAWKQMKGVRSLSEARHPFLGSCTRYPVQVISMLWVFYAVAPTSVFLRPGR
jgi:hypothetical protein